MKKTVGPVKRKLDALYEKLNRRDYVHPDPLEFLYPYEDASDREIVGLVASALAYGKVASILKSVSFVLKIMERSPSAFLEETPFEIIKNKMDGFVHRFADCERTSSFLYATGKVVQEYGSLGECFMHGQKKDDDTVFSGLCFFAESIRKFCPACPGHLSPEPLKRSACKRFNLYFRWMVRRDDVDPGGWDPGLRAKLIVPLDAHMHRVGLGMGFTRRRSADMKTALEITECFKRMEPEDPVRYDFCLTRLGIRQEMDLESFLKK